MGAMEQEYAHVAQQIRDFIRGTLTAAGFSRVIVNLSGGVDPVVTAALALQAVGPQQLFLAMMICSPQGVQPSCETPKR